MKPVMAITVTTMAESIMMASSNLMLVYLAANGPTMAARPIARPMLAMLLPTTLPMMICGVSPLTMDVMHSGADDPKASTVNPMTNGATPRRSAIPLAPLTIQSEPKYSITIPIGMPSSIQSMTSPDTPTINRYQKTQHQRRSLTECTPGGMRRP